jgi:uncharacterized protein YukE
MAGTVQVDPTALKKAAATTQSLGDQAQSLGAGLRAMLSGVESDNANRPWGNDGGGTRFADGANGYKAARDSLLTGIDAIATTLHEFAAGQNAAAAVLLGQDQGSAQGLTLH